MFEYRSDQIQGPGSILLDFSIIGIMMFNVVYALGELAVMYPVSGGFYVYSTRFIDPSWGFAMGWNYVFQVSHFTSRTKQASFEYNHVSNLQITVGHRPTSRVDGLWFDNQLLGRSQRHQSRCLDHSFLGCNYLHQHFRNSGICRGRILVVPPQALGHR